MTHGLACIGHREHGREREGNTVIAGGRGGEKRRRIVLRTSNFVYCAARPSSESNGPAHGYRLGARLLPRIFSIPECDAKITTATLKVMQWIKLGRTKLDLETGKKWKSSGFQTSGRRSSSSAINFFWRHLKDLWRRSLSTSLSISLSSESGI